MTFISTIEPGLMIRAFSLGSKSLVSLAPERTLSKVGRVGGLYWTPLTRKARPAESTANVKDILNTWSAGPEPVMPGLSRGTSKEVSYCHLI